MRITRTGEASRLNNRCYRKINKAGVKNSKCKDNTFDDMFRAEIEKQLIDKEYAEQIAKKYSTV